MGSSFPNSVWECRCPGNSVATPAKLSWKARPRRPLAAALRRRQVRYQTEFGNKGLKYPAVTFQTAARKSGFGAAKSTLRVRKPRLATARQDLGMTQSMLGLMKSLLRIAK